MRKLLIIEDEIAIRANLVRLLSIEGFTVLEATDGLAGLAIAKAELPALIICDVMMPELDGYGVLDGIRSDPATADIPFVFLSASADVCDLEAGLSRGATTYITKPFKLNEILDVVRKLHSDRQSENP